MLGALFLARLGYGMQFQSLPPVLLPFMEDLNLNYAQAGTLIGIYLLPGAFVSLPGGMLAVRLGDRSLLAGGLILMALGGVLLAMAPGFYLAVAARIVSGVGGTLALVLQLKMVTDRFEGPELATGLGVVSAAYPLGIALNFTTFGALAEAFSWRVCQMIPIGVLLVAFVMVWLWVPKRQAGRTEGVAAPEKLWVISRNEFFLVVLAGWVWLCLNTGLVVYLGFAPPMFVEGGFTQVRAGFVISLLTWVSIFSVPLGGWLSDRLRAPNGMILTGTLGLTGVVLLASPEGPVLFWMLLGGLFLGLSPGAILSLSGEVLRPESRGTGSGVFYTVYFIGMALFPFVAGKIRDITASAEAPIWFAGGLIFSSAVFLLIFRLAKSRMPVPKI